jgi:hypothetical protein
MKKIQTNMTILLGLGVAISGLLIEKKIITGQELVKALAEVSDETEKNLSSVLDKKDKGEG